MTEAEMEKLTDVQLASRMTEVSKARDALSAEARLIAQIRLRRVINQRLRDHVRHLPADNPVRQKVEEALGPVTPAPEGKGREM